MWPELPAPAAPVAPAAPALAPAAAPAPSRLKRTLQTLRSPFRAGSPFHISSLKRSASTKSSVSDSGPARADRTMRKKGKKRADASASRATDPQNKPTGLLGRMGSIGKKRGESASSADDPRPDDPKPDEPTRSDASTRSDEPTRSDERRDEPSRPADRAGDDDKRSVDSEVPSTSASEDRGSTPEPPPFSIAVDHPVAVRAFTKEAWRRRSKTEIAKPVEEPSPAGAQKRRIAFVAQASMYQSEEPADDGEEEEGEVGSLEEAVALARQRLARAHSHEREDADMPAYGDLIEPDKAGSEESHASSSERREHLYKILVIGELGTGKTSIIKRYVHQFFSQHYRATIGVDFALKVLNWDANTIIRLQLWDIAGQERFGNMTRVYYKEAVGAFIVFDVSRAATFDAVVKWKADLDSKVQLPDGSPIPCILLANKCDQQKEGIVNTPAKMEEYCREKGFAGWFETSAKENINIEEAARSLVNKILLNDKLLQSNDKDAEKFALDHKIANGDNNRDASSKSCAC